MKIIVTDNNTQEVIIYNIPNDRISLLQEEDDLSGVIEDLISDYHHLSETSWMILKENFIIEYKEL